MKIKELHNSNIDTEAIKILVKNTTNIKATANDLVLASYITNLVARVCVLEEIIFATADPKVIDAMYQKLDAYPRLIEVVEELYNSAKILKAMEEKAEKPMEELMKDLFGAAISEKMNKE